MVNYGVSRGCETCKQRRKKCDETRPVCQACIRAKRRCLGYKSDADLIFRHYQSEDPHVQQKQPHPLTPPSDASPPPSTHLQGMTIDELDGHALAIFLRDYCVAPADPSFSRGYLQGVASIIRRSGTKSDVASAARIVALGGIGRRWHREPLRQRAQWLYQIQLRAFQARVAQESITQSQESLMIAILFGLYEIISTPIPAQSEHGVHALGITAILRTNNSPFGLLEEIANGSPLRRPNPRIFGPLDSKSFFPGLDTLSLEIAPLFKRASNAFNGEGQTRLDASFFRTLCFDTQSFFDKLLHWSRHQHSSWQPRCVGVAGEAQSRGPHGAVFWPGRVDVYLDLWVAAVWLVFRKGSIMLAAIAARCATALPSDNEVAAIASRLQQEINPIVESMLASIPFFLLADVRAAFQDPPEKLDPGAPVGGILMMHPTYISLTNREVFSSEVFAYLKGCLAWMSDWLGLGQAKALSETAGAVPERSTADAHTIVWAGMVV